MMNLTRHFRPCLAKALQPLAVRTMSGSANLVEVSINDKSGIATVTMNRPPVNSLNLELLQGLSKALQDLEDNRKCRGMILTSSSQTVFSAGLDIMEMYKPKPDRVKAFWTTLQEVWLQLFGSSFPTVAAINGHSPAGGCLLSLSCEYRVMCPKYTIGLNETKLGIVAPKWFMASMLAAIPYRQAELALTTGQMFSTEEALKVGLIDEIASDKADAIAKAEKFLSTFAKIHPVARKLTKLNMRHDALDWLQQNRELDLNIFLSFVNQPVVQASLEKYLEALKNKGGK